MSPSSTGNWVNMRCMPMRGISICSATMRQISRGYYKDGVQEFLVHGHQQAINYEQGTKVALNYDKTIAGGESVTIKLRLSDSVEGNAFGDFDSIFSDRIRETDEFYAELQHDMTSEDEKLVQRQAFAGMLWNKQ